MNINLLVQLLIERPQLLHQKFGLFLVQLFAIFHDVDNGIYYQTLHKNSEIQYHLFAAHFPHG